MWSICAKASQKLALRNNNPEEKNRKKEKSSQICTLEAMSSFLPSFYFHGPSFIRIDIISSEDITVIASPMARGLMAHFSASEKQDRAIKLTRLGNFWPIADRKLRFHPIGEQKPLAAILETTGRVSARNYFRGGA